VHAESTRTGLGWLAIAAFGIMAAGGGLAALLAEQSHIFAGGFTPQERIERIISGDRQIGLSSLTQRQYMIDCRNSTIAAAQLELDRGVRDALAQACLGSAQRVIDTSPGSSFAWFAKAHASLALSDWAAMNEALALSQMTGANEGWIARYRVELAEDNRGRLDASYLPSHKADLAVLADNMLAYQNFLARLYVLRPASRPDLTDVIEQLPAQSQRVFLAATERARQAQAKGQL